MGASQLLSPSTDPVELFELFNAGFGGKLLVAATHHLHVFSVLAEGQWTFHTLREKLGLEYRPMHVLITAMRALGLISLHNERLALTPRAVAFLDSNSPLDVSDYLDLAADAPGVLSLVQSLRTNRPKGSQAGGEGAQYIYRDGVKSAMTDASQARRLTMALAGRAKNTAPVLAERQPLDDARLLLDVAGGTGIFSVAYLQRYPKLRAVVLELPEVVPLVEEIAAAYGVQDRLEVRAADMFQDPFPEGVDAILLSNVLHDWDIPECRRLLARCAEVLPRGGQLLIHDAFLNDALDGPLPIAIYSIILFYLTEGRAYSAAEYRRWLGEAGFTHGEVIPTMVHCGVLAAVKGG